MYVQPFPGPGGSNEGGTEPLWSRNGKQLFYWKGNKRWVVDIQNGSAFSAGRPRLLFEQAGYWGGSQIRNWDISLDDQRFLMVKREERKPQPVTEIILVQSTQSPWLEMRGNREAPRPSETHAKSDMGN